MSRKSEYQVFKCNNCNWTKKVPRNFEKGRSWLKEYFYTCPKCNATVKKV